VNINGAINPNPNEGRPKNSKKINTGSIAVFPYLMYKNKKGVESSTPFFSFKV